MFTTVRSPKERAVAGAVLLDDKNPGWFKAIDCATLDISSGCRCVLGQLFGTFGLGVAALGITEATSLGFMGVSDDLNEAWREEIAKRRLAPVRVKVEHC